MAQWAILQFPLQLMNEEEMTILVKARVIMHNMIVDARRDTYESGMASLVNSEETFVQAVRKENIIFNPSATVPGISRMIGGALSSWADRVAARGEEVKSMYAHTSLKLDLIEHLWQRRGDDE